MKKNAEPRGPLSLTNDIIAYEQGELDDDATVELFQRLVDNGMAWTLQGHYGRTAHAMIEAGLLTLPTVKVQKPVGVPYRWACERDGCGARSATEVTKQSDGSYKCRKHAGGKP